MIALFHTGPFQMEIHRYSFALGIVPIKKKKNKKPFRLRLIHRDNGCFGIGFGRWQAKFRSVSLRLGYIGNTCWAFLFFPVTRGSSILPLVGLTSESSIKYHIWLGHISTILFSAHTLGFIIYWAMTNQMAQVLALY